MLDFILDVFSVVQDERGLDIGLVLRLRRGPTTSPRENVSL
jgi:hypothetical protein